jgi:hypothetical protein
VDLKTILRKIELKKQFIHILEEEVKEKEADRLATETAGNSAPAFRR